MLTTIMYRAIHFLCYLCLLSATLNAQAAPSQTPWHEAVDTISVEDYFASEERTYESRTPSPLFDEINEIFKNQIRKFSFNGYLVLGSSLDICACVAPMIAKKISQIPGVEFARLIFLSQIDPNTPNNPTLHSVLLVKAQETYLSIDHNYVTKMTDLESLYKFKYAAWNNEDRYVRAEEHVSKPIDWQPINVLFSQARASQVRKTIPPLVYETATLAFDRYRLLIERAISSYQQNNRKPEVLADFFNTKAFWYFVNYSEILIKQSKISPMQIHIDYCRKYSVP